MGSPRIASWLDRVPGGRRLFCLYELAWISLGLNGFLAALKLGVGYADASRTLMADGAHSLADLFVNLIFLAGVRYWSAPPDKEHPYGHWKMENMCSAASALLLIVLAIYIAYDALASINDFHAELPGAVAVVAAVSNLAVKIGFYAWLKHFGRKIGDEASAQAQAAHQLRDLYPALGVLLCIGIAVARPRFYYIDHAGALMLAFFILFESGVMISGALTALADGGLWGALRARIIELVSGIEGVLSMHAVRVRRMGLGFFVDFHLLVNGRMRVREAHRIAEKAKTLLFDAGEDIVDVNVHIEPDLRAPTDNWDAKEILKK